MHSGNSVLSFSPPNPAPLRHLQQKLINLSVVSQAPDVQVDALGEPVSGRVDSDALNNNKGIENQVVVRQNSSIRLSEVYQSYCNSMFSKPSSPTGILTFEVRSSPPPSSRRALSAPLKRPGVIIEGMNEAIALMGE
eukprot:gene32598-42218_t